MKRANTSSLPSHGGDLSAAEARFGAPADGWLDLSTGINPQAYPLGEVDPALLARLPDRAATEALADAARSAYALADGAAIAPVPGSELAIRQIPHLLRHEKAVIVGPTYPSHGEAWAETGCEIAEIPEFDLVPGDADVVVIANPNNPDGRVCAIDPIATVAHRLAARGGVMVVDEAYADIDPAMSLMPVLDDVPALVLRSFGKFFGLPGLRLGFVAGRPELVDRLANRLGDWPVAPLAIDVATRALADTAWQEATRQRLREDAAKLDGVLNARGLHVTGGTSLYRLAIHDDAHRLYEELGQRGILVRAFAREPSWLRFGLPAGVAGLDRLDVALADILG